MPPATKSIPRRPPGRPRGDSFEVIQRRLAKAREEAKNAPRPRKLWRGGGVRPRRGLSRERQYFAPDPEVLDGIEAAIAEARQARAEGRELAPALEVLAQATAELRSLRARVGRSGGVTTSEARRLEELAQAMRREKRNLRRAAHGRERPVEQPHPRRSAVEPWTVPDEFLAEVRRASERLYSAENK